MNVHHARRASGATRSTSGALAPSRRARAAVTAIACLIAAVGADQARAAVIEADTLAVRSGPPHAEVIGDAAASGGRALEMRSSNSASGTVAAGHAVRVSVRARGDQCDGAPILALAVDGRTVLATPVSGTSYAAYSVDVDIPAGSHRIEVAFTNDHLGACDRNLYIDSLTLEEDRSGGTEASGYWSSTFAGNGALPTEWTIWYPVAEYGAWGQGQSNELNTPASFGIPGPPSGIARVARLWHAAGDPATHHKLYKSFHANTWPSGAGEPADGAPADVSGRYITELYIDTRSIQNVCGALIAQFKEEYRTGAGAYHNDSQWWLEYDCWLNDPNNIVMRLKANGVTSAAAWSAQAYMNRWITLELRVYQWERIEVWIDGVLKGVARGTARQAVGRQYFPPGAPQLSQPGTLSYDPFNGGGAVARSVGFIYGTGNYTSRQSLVYLGRTQLLPTP